MPTPFAFSILSLDQLEVVVGGKTAAKPTAQPTAAPTKPFDPAQIVPDAIKGCLTGGIPGLLTGPHGALAACGIGAGKAVLTDLGAAAASKR